MHKVAIDLPVILDPHKLLILLAGLDRTHEEILVPDILRYIEVWAAPGKGWPVPPMTLKILEEDYDEKLDKFFGFDSQRIAPNNFCAGIRLFQYAKKNDMVTLFDSARFTSIGQHVLNTDRFYNPFYPQKLPSGVTLTVNPDLPYALESLIGVQEELSAVPVFGDIEFLAHINKQRPTGSIRDHAGELKVDSQMSLLLDCPKDVTFEELLWFAKNREKFDAVSEKLKFGNDWKLAPKDIGIMGLKFGGTLTTDILLFGGAPVTSGGLFVYELASRVLRVTSKKDPKS